MKRKEHRWLISCDVYDMWGRDLRLHIDKEVRAFSKKQAVVRALGYAKNVLGLQYDTKVSAENVEARDLTAEDEKIEFDAFIERNKQDWLVLGDEY